METRRNSKIIVFVLLIALVFSSVTPLVSPTVYAAEGGTGIGNTEIIDFDAPTAETITYPALLKNSNLGGDVAITTGALGHWEWKDPEIKPISSTVAGKNLEYEVQFIFNTESDRNTYKSVTTKVAIEVHKGNLKRHLYKGTIHLNYGQQLKDADLTDANDSTVVKDINEQIIPGYWDWDSSVKDLYPTAYSISEAQGSSSFNGAWKEFPATYIPEDDPNYNNLDEPELSIYIYKADLKVDNDNKPTASSIRYGQKLDNSKITTPDAIGVSGDKIPGTWYWMNKDDLLNADDNPQSRQAYFVPTNNKNYEYIQTYALKTDIDVKVDKAKLKVGDLQTEKPAATSITYGQQLSDSVISKGIVYNISDGKRVYGDWDWAPGEEDGIPDASTTPQAAVFSPSDPDNLEELPYGIVVQVNKFTPKVKEGDETDSITITYGALLGSKIINDTVKGYKEDINVNGDWEWVNADKKLPVSVSNQKIKFVPKDGSSDNHDGTNYNTIERTIQVTVEPADLKIETEPTATSIVYLNTAQKSKLSDGVVTFGGVQVKGYWKWEDERFVPTMGSISQTAVFTISDQAFDVKNFNKLTTDVKIPVTAAKLQLENAPSIDGITYGQPVSEAAFKGTTSVVAKDNTGILVPGKWTWSTPSALLPAGSPSYTAIFTATDINGVNSNYEPLPYEFQVEVAQAKATVITAPPKVIVEAGTYASEAAIDINGTSVVKGVTTGSISGTWKFDYTEDESKLSEGTYTRSAIFTETNGNYEPVSTDVALEVSAKLISSDELKYENEDPVESVTVSALITAGEPLTKYAITGPSILDYTGDEYDITTIGGVWKWGDNPDIHADQQNVEIIFQPTDPNFGPVRYIINIHVNKIIILSNKVKGPNESVITEIVQPNAEPGIGGTLGNNITGPSIISIEDNPNITTLGGVWSWKNPEQPVVPDTNTATAVFTPINNDYAPIEFIIEFEVTKLELDPDSITDENDNSIYEVVTTDKSEVIAKETLSSAGISGPSIIKIDGEGTTISGIWSWKNPSDGVKYPTSAAIAVFTPDSDYQQYKPFEIIVTISAIQIELDLSDLTDSNDSPLTSVVATESDNNKTIPKNKLTDAGINGPKVIKLNDADDTTISGIWTWKDSEQEIKAGNNTAAAIFTPNDGDYKPFEVIVSFDVNQIELDAEKLETENGTSPAFVVKTSPEGIDYKPGETLSMSSIIGPDTLRDKENTSDTFKGEWSWEEDYELVVGDNQLIAVFTPEDEDYAPVTYEITYNVPQIQLDPDDLTVSADPTSSKVAVCLAVDPELGSGNKVSDSKPTVSGVYYDGELMPGTWRWADECADNPVTDGSNNVKAIFTPENGDYAEITFEFSFEVTKIAYNEDQLTDSDGTSISSILSDLLIIEPKKELDDQQDQDWPDKVFVGDEELEGDWSFADGDTVPTAGPVKKIRVKFQPNSTEGKDYVPIYIYVYVTVDAIDLDDKPSSDEVGSKDLVFEGDKLTNHAIDAPDIKYNGEKVKGIWKWKDPYGTKDLKKGKTTAVAVFVPEDSDFAEVEVEVEINVLPPAGSITEDDLKTEDGRAITEDIEFNQQGFISGDKLEKIIIQGPTVYINGQVVDGQWKWKDKDIVPPVGSSTQQIVFVPANDRIPEITMGISVNVNPINTTGLTLNYTSRNVNKGNTLQLKATVKPSNATYKEVTWTSSNPKIASVNSKTGLVKANSTEGMATITAKLKDGKTAKCTIKVVAPVTKIRTSLSTLTLKKKTKYKIYPVADNGSKKVTTKLTYKSSNKKVATVSSTGKIKAKKKGTAKITITAYNGKTKVIKVKVVTKKKTLKKASVKLPKKMKVGKTKQLKVKLKTKKATNVKVTYKSTNKKVATVDKAGRITAKKKGKTTIKVKIGKKTYKKKLKVTKK